MGAVLIGICLVVIIFSAISFAGIDGKSLSDAKKAVSERLGGGVDREGSYQSIYANTYYSIAIPQEMVVHKYSAQSGTLSSVKIIGEKSTISIDVFAASDITFSELSKPFEVLKYEVSQDLLPIGPSTSYMGSISFDPQLFEKVALIKKGNTTIRLILSTLGERDYDSEKSFTVMLQSIR